MQGMKVPSMREVLSSIERANKILIDNPDVEITCDRGLCYRVWRSLGLRPLEALRLVYGPNAIPWAWVAHNRDPQRPPENIRIVVEARCKAQTAIYYDLLFKRPETT